MFLGKTEPWASCGIENNLKKKYVMRLDTDVAKRTMIANLGNLREKGEKSV